ncbi:uncharacterized protein BO97DRAFT_411421 [Aspergillus homomorphus CBS 101889]|uniref:Uncharacterized protein n=1 Tax=Aspergillus homomorphus (strain CBS 101889) TaxID=1450537 RepID=A0A395IDF1_ASPHC|nr:hypothetical protein BO97DRAFT_411421 [Aspergillus homomorphus CBS 101889]RAL16184.1 hypothetical protein BO97DRAFT_411421 [Aspergillus homomorphus CBS 101889]
MDGASAIFAFVQVGLSIATTLNTYIADVRHRRDDIANREGPVRRSPSPSPSFRGRSPPQRYRPRPRSYGPGWRPSRRFGSRSRSYVRERMDPGAGQRVYAEEVTESEESGDEGPPDDVLVDRIMTRYTGQPIERNVGTEGL